MTFIGDCLANADELKSSVGTAVNDQWERLAVWPGTYVAVVEKPGVVYVQGDLAGSMPIYYVADPVEGIWWSTAATPLAAMVGSSVQLGSLALELSVVDIDRFCGRVPFRGVHVVPPGSYLSVRDGAVRVERWYSPGYHSSLPVAAEHLRDALQDSVARRSQDDLVASDLSGGLDSSSVALLAARSTEVVGVTYQDQWMKSEDPDYASRVAESHSKLQQVVVEGGPTTVHYSGLEVLDEEHQTDLPSMDLVLAGYNRAKQEAALRAGAHRYLTGMAGDSVLHGPLSYLADLYRSGGRIEALREATGQARRVTVAPSRMISAMRGLAKRTFQQDLGRLVQIVRGGSVDDSLYDPPLAMRWCRPVAGLNWLSQDGRKLVAEELKAYNLVHGSATPALHHDWLGVRQAAAMRSATLLAARARGLSLDAPFLDAQVLRAGLELPSYERMRRDSFKPLLREALGDVLPAFLLQRTTKGTFGGTMYEGLRRQHPVLMHMAETSRLVQEGIVEIGPLLADLQRAAIGSRAPLYAIHQFVVVDAWLRTLDLRQETWWTRTIQS